MIKIVDKDNISHIAAPTRCLYINVSEYGTVVAIKVKSRSQISNVRLISLALRQHNQELLHIIIKALLKLLHHPLVARLLERVLHLLRFLINSFLPAPDG